MVIEAGSFVSVAIFGGSLAVSRAVVVSFKIAFGARFAAGACRTVAYRVGQLGRAPRSIVSFLWGRQGPFLIGVRERINLATPFKFAACKIEEHEL